MVQYLAVIASKAKQSSKTDNKDETAGLPRRFTPRNDESGLSVEATAVLDAGRTLWQAYFAHTDVRNVRDAFKLNRPDVGWYQIRNALKARNASGDFPPGIFKVSFLR